MNKRVVAVRRLDENHLAQLRQLFHVDCFDSLGPDNEQAYIQAMRRAHGLIGGKLTINRQLLDESPHLKVISTISVGYDNLPLDELTQRGILLCNTPDVLTETTADTGFALIMATARRVVELAELVKQGNWLGHIDKPLFGLDVHGKVLGIIGMGRIGAAVARRGALGFGMRVRYSNSSPKPALETELGAQRCDMDELLAQSDFVCISVPLTTETHQLIGAEAFRKMKSSAILINISRGKVVDEAALIDALNEGQIGGAGLDVFEEEPVSRDSPLLQMTNVVALPHIGSATHETRAAMAQLAVDNLILALQGEWPKSAVNEQVLAAKH
ncbi:2-hydroxyacid dehydrogenase [Marinobacter antarcticus]|uniref:Glyoxylate/hydroxypyruvate reductase B n=3 Tax=root TaxID=1 RepID=A0A831VZB2_9GAMM|nr:D-glycerate dehydrogenase [Marinobacter antarcticus]HEA53506.1 D-glycerate dehydrogenase [Marinobacter antarcticus]